MVFEKIKELIIDQLALDESTVITMDTSLVDDLEADSLDAVEIIMSIEDEYGIEIPDEAATEFKTIKDLVEYVESVRD
ncbi:MAG: acyl carrier protein [Agathobacter sp.]